MKVLVTGLGSMGRRRIGILKNYYDYLSVYGVDKREDRRQNCTNQFSIETFNDFFYAYKKIKPEIVFACTPPELHKNIVLFSLKNGSHTFSEINLINNGYKEITRIASQKNRVAFLSSTMLYREEIKWILKRLKNQTNYSYRYHVGQYLPDWHPWEDYRNYFIARKQTNACREILAVELPWIIYAFGQVTDFRVLKTKTSSLLIDYPDTYHVILKHVSGTIGNISVDVVSRKPINSLEIYSTDFHVFWEGTPESLKEFNINNKQLNDIVLYNSVKVNNSYSDKIIENPYIEEVRSFFDSLKDCRKQINYTYENDNYVLELIDEIENGEIKK